MSMMKMNNNNALAWRAQWEFILKVHGSMKRRAYRYIDLTGDSSGGCRDTRGEALTYRE